MAYAGELEASHLREITAVKAVNRLFTKIEAAKKARQMLKKQKEMFSNTNEEVYPTI